ncbi:MAG: type VI secretion system tube protein Hcp [Phycisphaerales bacterium]
MQAYIQIDKIKGQVTEKEHKEWIAVLSFSFGLNNMITGDPSKQGKLVGGQVTYQDISIVKETDTASPLIASQCSKGAPIDKIIIHVCEDTNKVEPVVVFTLEKCVISSFQVSGGSSGTPTESLSIAFSKVTMEVTHKDETSKTKATQKYTYDLLLKQVA